VAGNPVPTTYIDRNIGCAKGTYFVTTVLADGRESLPSASFTVTVPCIVIGYLSPLITAGDSSYSGGFKGTSGVTIAWQLKQFSGTYLNNLNLNLLGATYAVSTPTSSCLPTAVPLGFQQTLFSPTSGPAANSTFVFNPTTNAFTFNWNTTALPKGCYVIELDLGDGQVKRTALKLQ
jgi:hypothetical protein